ncbi:MAG: O-antigen polymerase [Sulfuricaulis sp.]|uniref:O-antigen polymerase n=1 Tax=Sulfuricaulis sp. TaxID=2003553 RepID=UPI0034A4499B
MIYVVVLALAMLLALNYYWNRSLLAPAALYAAVWCASVAGLMFSGDTLYPVSDQTLFLYLLGAVAFTLGAIFTDVCIPIVAKRSLANLGIRRPFFYFVLDIVLAVALLGLPMYLKEAAGELDMGNPAYYFATMRQAVVEASGQVRTFSVVRNLSIVSLLLAMAMHYENNGTGARRWRAYLAIGIALIYGVAEGTKGNAVVLVVMLLFISWVKTGRINPKQLIVGGTSVLAFFSVGLLLVNYAYMDTGGLVESARFLLPVIQNYWLGGLVAFDRIMLDPGSIEAVQSVNRFFLETANSVGASFPVPSLHAEFTDISATMDTNVYTIYYTYFLDFGWFGTVLCLAVLGGILTWVFRLARRGLPVAVMLYAIAAAGIVLSFHAEHFLLALNFILKTIIFFSFLYLVVARTAPVRSSAGRPINA